jgi:uncharacterized protein with LGFP repeats
MEGWVTNAENGNNKWVQIFWHDIFTTQNIGTSTDVYYQMLPQFQQFLTWLQGEVVAGRVQVKTAGQVMNAPIVPPPSDKTAPVVSITAPVKNATVSATVNATVKATDNVGVVKVVYYLDGVAVNTSTTSPFGWAWNTTTASNAKHSLVAKAYDAAGNVGTSATVSVTVKNTSITPTGAINTLWVSLGGASGFLGAATTNAVAVPGVSGATYEDFVGGRIYYSSATGAHEMHGPILAEMKSLGGESWLGLPTTNQTATPSGGAYNTLSKSAAIYWSAATGAYAVHGAIGAAWVAQGSEAGPLGYPTSDEVTTSGVVRENFQNGHYITWTSAGGVVII